MENHPLITRVETDHNRTYGWNVRITRNGVCTSKFFSDRKNGGKAKALRLAQEWRDANHVPRVSSNRTYRTTARVCLATIRNRAFWRAIIPGDDSMRTKSFSVDRYGHDEAKRLATEFLESQTTLPS